MRIFHLVVDEERRSPNHWLVCLCFVFPSVLWHWRLDYR